VRFNKSNVPTQRCTRGWAVCHLKHRVSYLSAREYAHLDGCSARSPPSWRKKMGRSEKRKQEASGENTVKLAVRLAGGKELLHRSRARPHRFVERKRHISSRVKSALRFNPSLKFNRLIGYDSIARLISRSGVHLYPRNTRVTHSIALLNTQTVMLYLAW